MLHGTILKQKKFEDFVQDCNAQPHSHTFKEQQTIINSLCNDSRPNGGRGISFFCHFSTGTGDVDQKGQSLSQWAPTSVRNRVLYFFRRDRRDEQLKALQPSSAVCKRKNESASQEATSSRTKKSRTEDVPTIPEYAPFHAPPEESESTPFTKFVHNLVSLTGLFQWRIHTLDEDVIAMNDIDLNSGIFQKNTFIHMHRQKSSTSEELAYFCDCKMFSTVQQMENETSGSPKHCCHIRFFTEHVEHLYNVLFTNIDCLPQTPLGLKLSKSTATINNAVVRLDISEKNHRFSVVSTDMQSAAIVKLNVNRFSCTYGACRATKGHTRKTIHLGDGTSCVHINALNDNPEMWQDLVVQELGNKSEPTVNESDDPQEAISVEDDVVQVDDSEKVIILSYHLINHVCS